MVVQWWRSLVMAGIVAMLLVSCRQAVPTQNMRDRIVLGTTAKVATVDPADASSSFAGALLYNLSDRLYTYKLGTTELEPQLASALPQVSADGLVYKIPLRQGVVFHDGTPFNAAAMAFSLNRLRENQGSAPISLSEAKSIVASGEYELTITLKKPFTAFPALLTFTGTAAVSPKAYEIKENSFKPKEFVGTGPYKLTQFGTDLIRLEPFEQYWGGKPANAGVDIQLLSSGANLYNAFRTGKIDLALQGLAVEQIRNLQSDAAQKGWQVVERSGNGINYIVPNMKSAPLDQLAVRQALALAVDRSILQERVFAGQVEPLYSLLPNQMTGQTQVFRETYGDGQFDRAQELLKQAGFSPQKPAVVELWYRSNITTDQFVALTLKAVIRQKLAGLMQIELNSVESTTAYGRLNQSVYPSFILDWSGDYFDPDTYIYPFLDCEKGEKQVCAEGQTPEGGSFYFSEAANQLVAASRKERDPGKRTQILSQLQQLVAQDVPYIPLWQGKDYLFIQKGISGGSLEVTQKVPFWKLRKE
jgi:peptide/nickel transport system substrate-binding protein